MRSISIYRNLVTKLAGLDTLVDWEAFRPIVNQLYHSNSVQGGRPNTDEVLLVKVVVLQSLYGLTDPELERQANDRISFRKFLGFPDKIPGFTTIWYFRERLIEAGKEQEIWDQLQHQLDAKG